MTDDNPLFNFGSERTIIKPSAGRQAKAGPNQATGMSQPAGAAGGQNTFGLTQRYQSLNPQEIIESPSPLLSCAQPLIYAGPLIRNCVSGIDPAGLKSELVEAMKMFETLGNRLGFSQEAVIGTRYLLCTFLDECASNTPWGGSGVWSKYSLLVHFHNEAWGGEKCFMLLSKLGKNPSSNLDLLKIFHVVLCMGFEGKYKVESTGPAQLREVRSKLAGLIESHNPNKEQVLADFWKSPLKHNELAERKIPIWLAPVIATGFAFAIFAVMRLAINTHTEPVFDRVVQLKLPVVQRLQAAPAPPPKVTLASFLEPEIAEGLVKVLDSADRSLITFQGDGLFKPGSAQLNSAFMPLFNRVADALKAVPGRVLVTGHTDNIPIRSIQFPSNWHLSKERALEVSNILGSQIGATRVQSEGRSDTEPVASNKTPDGRAANRRVEVTLFRQER